MCSRASSNSKRMRIPGTLLLLGMAGAAVLRGQDPREAAVARAFREYDAGRRLELLVGALNPTAGPPRGAWAVGCSSRADYPSRTVGSDAPWRCEGDTEDNPTTPDSVKAPEANSGASTGFRDGTRRNADRWLRRPAWAKLRAARRDGTTSMFVRTDAHPVEVVGSRTDRGARRNQLNSIRMAPGVSVGQGGGSDSVG